MTKITSGENSCGLQPEVWKAKTNKRRGQVGYYGTSWAEAEEDGSVRLALDLVETGEGHGNQADCMGHEPPRRPDRPAQRLQQAVAQQQRQSQFGLSLATRPNSLYTVQSPASASYRARLDRRAAVQNHTRERAAPRFRACDITQCELYPLRWLTARLCLGNVVIATSDACSSLLGQSWSMSSTSLGTLLAQDGTRGPSQSFHRTLVGQLEVLLSRLRSVRMHTPRTDLLCGKPLVLLRCSWRKIILSRLIGRTS